MKKGGLDLLVRPFEVAAVLKYNHEAPLKNYRTS